MEPLKRTPLYEAHVSAGATLVDFGGWEMPVQYPTGIVAEHLYDRIHCGIFDVSHMGRLMVEGPERVAFLQKVLSSNVAALEIGHAQYCIIPNEQGGAVDDAYLYMYEEDRYMLVVNASNTEKDLAHFAKYLPEFDCTVTNISESCASIAVQGPEAEKILQTLSGCQVITDPKRNALSELTMEGRTVRVSRTGYTGDPTGYELFIDASEALWLWNRLQELGAKPVGLGARDTLRLEAGLPLYGHEMGNDPSGEEMPVFAVPLSRFAVSFKEEKGDFVGRKALTAQKDHLNKKVVPVELADRGVMRPGMDIYKDGAHVGWITSGTMVPYYDFDETGHLLDTTGKRSIGFAYLDSSVTLQDAIEIDVRGKRLHAKLVDKHLIQNDPPYAKAAIH